MEDDVPLAHFIETLDGIHNNLWAWRGATLSLIDMNDTWQPCSISVCFFYITLYVFQLCIVFVSYGTEKHTYRARATTEHVTQRERARYREKQHGVVCRANNHARNTPHTRHISRVVYHHLRRRANPAIMTIVNVWSHQFSVPMRATNIVCLVSRIPADYLLIILLSLFQFSCTAGSFAPANSSRPFQWMKVYVIILFMSHSLFISWGRPFDVCISIYMHYYLSINTWYREIVNEECIHYYVFVYMASAGQYSHYYS